MTSELSGFHRLNMDDRRARLAEIAGIDPRDLDVLSGASGLSDEQANRMVENVLGVMGLPLGLCVNLRIDGRDCLVPMATEEPSVVAAASFACKLMRAGGGIVTEVSPPHMIGQIQLLDVVDAEGAEAAVLAAKTELLALANHGHRALVAAGGGAIDIEVNHLPPVDADDPAGHMVIAHLIVDVRDAMGANAINSMCERIAPRVAELAGGRVGLRILSNLADRRTVRACGRVPLAALEGRGCESGETLARGIVEASVFAERDPYRAATHNKGIMNGIDSVLIAFGQDWRAVEAGAHAFAARGGRYTALARWRIRDGALCGELELPMAVGTVGGVAGVHPVAKLSRRVAAVSAASELASIVAAVGLAQNLSALRALAAEGIQRGHMRLHARNLAAEAGAPADEVEEIAEILSSRGTLSVDAARAVLREREEEKLRASLIPEIYDEPRSVEHGGRSLRDRFEILRETWLPQVMTLLARVVRESSPDDSTLDAMCAYHMDTGGKRLRAMLPLLVGEALGVEPGRLVPLGAACEMLHNATLVHDDLQDGDLVRRGRMTVWNRFGMPQAVNLGDAMFYYTLLCAQRLDVAPALREKLARRILVETLRVIDGQEREFSLKKILEPTLDDYFAMVEGKTSGLFALPMAAAAEIAGAPSELVAALEEAARHMGVLFQIQDDTLDLFGDKGREAPGSDVGEGKRSVLCVHALAHAPLADARWLREVLDKDRADTTADDVRAATALLERVGSLTFAIDEMLRRKARALAVVADHDALSELVGGMCDLFLRPIEPLLRQRAAQVTGAA